MKVHDETKRDTHTSDEGGDQGNTSLGGGNSLAKAKEEGEVDVDTLVTLELASSLDTFPC